MVDTFALASEGRRTLEHAGARFEFWSTGPDGFEADGDGTHYCVVGAGAVEMACRVGSFSVRAGMVFCVPGRLRVRGEGQIFGVSHIDGARGFFQPAGPVERLGRLRYIDGCTDSLLIPPQRRGDPCLNHLHFPTGIVQTRHTHPSFRAGLVLRGEGFCDTDAARIPLAAGVAFHIPANAGHRFVTLDQAMDVIAFHPDSDFGPTDDDHPMVNRTLVDGISARHIKEIRT